MRLLALLPEWLTAEGLLEIFGPWALAGFTVIIFVECGLFVGMFFPGDSLLFLTGMLVTSGALDYPLLLVIALLYIAAVAGNVVGYHLGEAIGPKLFSRPDSKILRPEYVQKTQDFFEKYGARAIVLARFVPIVRTLITAVAGIAHMDRKKFYFYSAVGAIFWVVGITSLGAALGDVPFVKANLELVLLSFVFLSTIPIVVEVIKHRRTAK